MHKYKLETQPANKKTRKEERKRKKERELKREMLVFPWDINLGILSHPSKCYTCELLIPQISLAC